MPPKSNAKSNPGVLPVPAATRAAATKPPATTRLKLEIRRLPPSLTLTEFEETLGPEWRLGGGKVDWREYRPGKLRSPGKLPEQSRVYIHVAREEYVRELEQRFLSVVFHDRAGTHKREDLRALPPTLGYATCQRTPLQVKQRGDGRQGTLDQDAEFIAFLEAETMPTVKPAVGVAEGEGKGERVKSTPLIEDLRAKKEARAKMAQEKAEKKVREEREKKAAATAKSEAKEVADKGGTSTQQQAKVEQAAKDAARVLTKQAAAKQNAPPTAAAASATQPKAAPVGPAARAKRVVQSPRQQNATPAASPAPAATTNTTGPATAAPERSGRPAPAQRPKGNADGIRKMLQKDLGIRPKAAAASTPAPASTLPSAAASTPATPPSTSTPAAPTPSLAPAPAASSPSPATIPQSSHHANTHKAYLKHANPSQGITEVLIQRTLSTFGPVSSVTIDPRKGTAIAVFADATGLGKAMEARRVPVGTAGGVVEVSEFKTRGAAVSAPGGGNGVVGGNGPSGTGGARGGGSMRGRGGFRGGRGGRGGAGAGAAGTATASRPAISSGNAAAGTPVSAPAKSVSEAPAPTSAPAPTPAPAPAAP
ncbi:hypothetical protein LTR53_002037 [Teratosphaeriaceae sp. CCFEE 6253]|nr:hypothetical protein LTR53_002037 [Teratosphaeriaceae sp. CCFEE 6253]